MLLVIFMLCYCHYGE